MYKDKDRQKEANRLAKQRQRTKGMTQEGMTGQGMTEGNTVYPAIIIALADPVKRKKLEAITQSLKSHNVLEGVRYGIGGPTFATVEKYLSVLK